MTLGKSFVSLKFPHLKKEGSNQMKSVIPSNLETLKSRSFSFPLEMQFGILSDLPFGEVVWGKKPIIT